MKRRTVLSRITAGTTSGVHTHKVALSSGLAAIRQCVAYCGPVVSLASMDAAVLREAAQRAPAAVPRGQILRGT